MDHGQRGGETFLDGHHSSYTRAEHGHYFLTHDVSIGELRARLSIAGVFVQTKNA
jgi:hypothetical protein